MINWRGLLFDMEINIRTHLRSYEQFNIQEK